MHTHRTHRTGRRPGNRGVLLTALVAVAALLTGPSGVADAAGPSWIPMGTGLYDVANDLVGTAYATLDLGGVTYVGGEFDEAGGVAVNSVAAWDGAAFAPLGDPATDGPSDIVWSFATDGTLLYVGGAFGVMSWDPGSEIWTDLFPTGLQAYALAWYDDGVDAYLVAGGYDTIGSTCALQWFDGIAWAALATPSRVGSPCTVDALEPFGDQLVVGGMFDHIGSDALNSVAIYDGATDTFLPLDGDVDNGVHDVINGGDEVGAVWALAVDEASGTIFLGGVFDDAGGVAVVDLAAWSAGAFTEIGLTTEQWIEGDEEVDALEYANGALAVGGWFNLDGTLVNIAALNLANDQWVPFLAGTDDVVLTIGLNETLGQVYVGGMFTTAYADQVPTPVADTGGIAMFGVVSTPPAMSSVSVTGTAAVGQVLTATVEATGDPTPTVTLQWIRCDAAVTPGAPVDGVTDVGTMLPSGCVTITDATGTTYTLADADGGRYVGVIALADNGAGTVAHLDVQSTAAAPASTTTSTTTTAPTTTTTLAGALPSTGGDASISAAAVLVLAVGAALLVPARRRWRH